MKNRSSALSRLQMIAYCSRDKKIIANFEGDLTSFNMRIYIHTHIYICIMYR